MSDLRTTRLTVRLDDVSRLDDRLCAVLSTLEENGVPVHLEVVPAWLQRHGGGDLERWAGAARVPVAVHQHGFRHVDRSTGRHRFEFGDDRSVEDQRIDLECGREILETRLGAYFVPLFSPPWNRLGASTLAALAAAGFAAWSSLARPDDPSHGALRFVPMTVDPVQWRPQPAHRPWDTTRDALVASLRDTGFAGLELHHEVMSPADVEGLDGLLRDLRARGVAFVPMDPAQGVWR